MTRRDGVWIAGLTAAIEILTCVMRFGFGLRSSHDTPSPPSRTRKVPATVTVVSTRARGRSSSPPAWRISLASALRSVAGSGALVSASFAACSQARPGGARKTSAVPRMPRMPRCEGGISRSRRRSSEPVASIRPLTGTRTAFWQAAMAASSSRDARPSMRPGHSEPRPFGLAALNAAWITATSWIKFRPPLPTAPSSFNIMPLHNW